MEENNVQVDGKSIDDYLGLSSRVDNNYHIDSAQVDGKDLSKDNFQIITDGSVYQIQYYNKSENRYSSSDILTPNQCQVDGNKITINLDASIVDAGDKGQKLTVTASIPDHAGKGLNKGQLDAVKSALENTSNRASDFVSQSQLQLQKVMQTYNVTVSLINSMQTLLEEMNKSIAQNIR